VRYDALARELLVEVRGYWASSSCFQFGYGVATVLWFFCRSAWLLMLLPLPSTIDRCALMR